MKLQNKNVTLKPFQNLQRDFLDDSNLWEPLLKEDLDDQVVILAKKNM